METARDDVQAMAQAWLEQKKNFLSGKEYEYREDVIDLSSIIDDDPEKSWEVIREIAINLRDNVWSLDSETLERMIGFLGAGDFEDLLQAHHSVLIDRVESEVGRNPIFRRVIQSAWQGDIPDSAWKRLQAVER